MSNDKHIHFFQQLLGKSQVTSPSLGKAFLTDWRKRYHGQALTILSPANSHDIGAILDYCHTHHLSVVTQGGNTGLVGGATPDKTGLNILILTKRLNCVLDVNPYDNSMLVETGCTLSQVHQAAKTVNRLFPLRLASEGSCTIGGNIATNAGGTQVLRYGTMRELVSGIEVYTPSGSKISTLEGLHKDNRGYSLTQLYSGSEGTLGVITKARLKLFPLPAEQITAWLALQNLHQVLEFFKLAQDKLPNLVSCFELISDLALTTVFNSFPETNKNQPNKAPWYVLLEIDCPWMMNLSLHVQTLLEQGLEKNILSQVYIAQNQTQAKQLRQWRELISEAQAKQGKNIKHDIALPINQLATFCHVLETKLQQHYPQTESVIFGHVGDGNLHYNIRSKHKRLTEQQLFELEPSINKLIYDTVYEHEGSLSAEHGIGQLKANILPDYIDSVRLDTLARIKQALDPKNIMNPGKLFP